MLEKDKLPHPTPKDKTSNMLRQKIRYLASMLVTSIFLMSNGVAAETNANGPLSFTILHTNDLHSHDVPYQYQGQSIGGMARFAHLMRSLRAKDPSVVTIDAGDIFEGTAFFTYYKGEVEVEMLNQAGYDIYTIGNHEFDDGSLNLAKQLEKAKFNVINCNLDATACPPLKALIKPSLIKEIKGQRVGFIGAIVPNLEQICLTLEGVKVKDASSDWMTPIKDEIAKLKEQGVNKIILVTHAGVEMDKKLAQLPDVDAIVGGHSHTRLDEAIRVQHSDGSTCLVVQTGCYGRAMGKLDLCFDADGKIDTAKTAYKLIDITKKIHSDADISSYLKKEAKPFAAANREVLTRATKEYDNHFHHLYNSSPLGDLLADALADGGASNGATIAVIQRGGIRSHIEEGPVTEQVVQELFPFDNKLVVATISGTDLRKVLETGVSGSPVQSVVLGGKFLDVHGIKFEWNPKLEPMHRIDKIWAIGSSGKLEPLNPDAKYRIAVNSYSFGGGEGFDYSRATDILYLPEKLSVYLHRYLLKCKKISPDQSDRIKAVPPATD